MNKTCHFCDTIYETNTDHICPVCRGVEPKRIFGYSRSKHPLYPRWKGICQQLLPRDETFNTFYLFVKWFNSKSKTLSDSVIRRDWNKGFSVENCFVDHQGYAFTKQSTFEKLTPEEHAKLKVCIELGHSVTQISETFYLTYPTAKKLIADFKRHQLMAKYT